MLRHKYFVFVAGLSVKASLWQLIIHDWSKLTPTEFIAYRNWFTLHQRDETSHVNFQTAWLHHIHTNPHHWEHWVLRHHTGTVTVLRMPERYVREMAADWMGMGRFFGNTASEWYERNRDAMALHPQTRSRIETLIGYKPAIEQVVDVKAPIHREIGT